MVELDEVAWALAGNVVVGLGAGTATLAAFAPSLPVVDGGNPVLRVGVVSIGFALFFAGYRLSQAGTHRNPEESLRESFLPSNGDADTADQRPPGGAGTATSDSGSTTVILAVRGVFVVLGVVGLGAGMRLFALTIETWSGTLGVATGVVCITGYIFGHLGMNWVVL